MSARARTIVKLCFILAFLLTAPVVLLMTLGYRYNWKKQRIERTGIIQVETRPAGARIFLNGTPQKKPTPHAFMRLLPEDYVVRIEKSGYLPWEKTVTVRSEETTFVTDVQLMRDELPRLRQAGDVTGAAFSPDGSRTAILKDDGEFRELMALERSGAPELLARFGKDSYVDETLVWSPDGRNLLMTAREPDGTPTLSLYPVSPPGEPRALHDDFPMARLSARWSSDGERIVIVASTGVFVVSADGGSISPVIFSLKIQDATLRGQVLYSLRDGVDGVALERSELGDPTDRADVALLPQGDYRFLLDDGKYVVLAERGRGRVLILSKADGALLDSFNATSAAWEDAERPKRLLLCSDLEVAVADVEAGTSMLITRLGSPITGCAWHPRGVAALYSTRSSIAAIELDDRDRRVTYDIVRFTDVGPFTVDAVTGMIRFVGSAGNVRGIYEKDL